MAKSINHGVMDYVRKPFYNVKARNEADAQYHATFGQVLAMIESGEDETEEGYAKYCELDKQADKLRLLCWALQFKVCKNAWFTKVVESIGETEHAKQITKKQYYAFYQYCNEETVDTWRDHTHYCRVGDYLVTLTWLNANRSILIKKYA